MVINCVREPIEVLMRVLLSIKDDDDDHEEVNYRNGVREEVGGLVGDAKEQERQSGVANVTLKSSLKKVDLDSTEGEKKKKKKKVQWVDVMGKELAEIREFESSEEDDMDSYGEKKCVCVIL